MIMTDMDLTFRNPDGYDLDFDLLYEFEEGLDTCHPEDNDIPSRVLGYGEISTVFELENEVFAGLALKRMSIFETKAEFNAYLTAYDEYHRLLENEIGIQLPNHGHAAFENGDGRPIFYIIQQKVEPETIGNHALSEMSKSEAQIVYAQVLQEMVKVWQFNKEHDHFEVALDGQISNWAITHYSPEGSQLLYIDTSTPIYRLDGIYQFDAELLLRAAPSFMRWILRRFFLDDVVARYYDERQIIIDLLANLYKEQLSELVPDFINVSNQFFADEMNGFNIDPIREDEVKAYYNEDKFIWSLYISMRRLDRFLQTKLLRQKYPYILPGKTNR